MTDRQASSAANTDRKAYPKDCPNCGLWLTAESMDCPRCMTKLPHESSAEQKREQALEAVRRAEEAGHTFHDQPMRAPSAAQVYIVARWLYIEEGEGFSIDGVFASEGAAQTFIDSEPIPGNRYSILNG